MRRFAALALTLLLAGSLAACGDDDSDTSTQPGPTADEPAEEPDDDGDEGGEPSGSDTPASSGDAGTATVDGTTYGFDQALRCDEDSLGIEGIDREIEAQFIGGSGEGRVQLDLYVQSIGGMPMHDVSWAGPEGVFSASFTQVGGSWMGEGDDLYQDAPISIDGSRATGSVVAYDAMTMEGTIDIDFDVVIPSDTFACR